MTKYVVIITTAYPDYKCPSASNTISQFDTMEEVEEYKQAFEEKVLNEYCKCDMIDLCKCQCYCGCGCNNMLECDGRHDHKEGDNHMCGRDSRVCNCKCNCVYDDLDIWDAYGEYADWVYSNSYMDMPPYDFEVVIVDIY